MGFKGTNEDWKIVEHNWSDTSIVANGKTICKFELDDIEDEDLTENNLSEEENSYNIKLIFKSKEMLEKLNDARKELLRIKGSMMAHPDCTKNSEFEGYVLSAEETIEEIEELIKEATEL